MAYAYMYACMHACTGVNVWTSELKWKGREGKERKGKINPRLGLSLDGESKCGPGGDLGVVVGYTRGGKKIAAVGRI